MADKTFVRDEWEVTSGKVHHVGEDGRRKLCRKGDRFHPTRESIERGAYENKARKVTDGGPHVGTTVGADIGLRALEWGSEAALEKALEAGLDAGELGEPSGKTGYVTSDVEAALEARG